MAVTKLDGTEITCQGEDVCEISECIGEKDSGLVILAVRENSDAYKAMREILMKLQFRNIMTVSAGKAG